MFSRILAAALALAAMCGAASAQLVDAARFVDPVSVRSASLSPNGGFIAYVRRTEQAQQIVVIDLASNQMRAVQSIPTGRGSFDWVFWKGDNRLVASINIAMVADGMAPTGTRRVNEDIEYSVNRIVALNRDGSGVVQMFEGQLRQLTYGYGSVFFLDPLVNDPDHVLVSAWDNSGTGVWRADIQTGRVERIANGSFDTVGYATDGVGNAVMRMDRLPNNTGYRVMRRAPGSGDWVFVQEVRRGLLVDDSPDFDLLGPGPGAGQVYVEARLNGADRSSFYLYDVTTGAFGDAIFESAEADVSVLLTDPTTREVMAGCEFAQRSQCRARDPQVQRHLNAVDGFFNRTATVSLVDMSNDRNKWLLHVDGPTEAGGYYLYDRAAGRMDAIAAIYPNLDPAALSPTQVVTYQASDGVSLWAYVTAQAGATGPRPMVVLPHGGPESRDFYGYDAYTQFLASRGYVVVQPNFRGSEGFGDAFKEAGRGQWGRRMQDDISDAVRHMIDSGVADPQRVCIVGASYGGYAALAGVTLTPDLYRCAIAIAPVSDLPEFLRTERGEGGRNSSNYAHWLRLVGDPNANAAALAAASPAQHADRVTAPVLLIHGEEDTTVLIAQAERMDRALRSAGKSTRLVRLEDADHYWDSWSTENRLTLFRESEQFLAQHLGAAN